MPEAESNRDICFNNTVLLMCKHGHGKKSEYPILYQKRNINHGVYREGIIFHVIINIHCTTILLFIYVKS